MADEDIFCPFCGKKAVVMCAASCLDGGSFYHMACPDCGASGPCRRTEREARKRWRRVCNKIRNTERRI